MKRPSFQFYPGDWLNDAALRMCSIGARGLWMDMICLMHQGSEYGYLKVNGKVILPDNLARMVGATLQEVEGWMIELSEVGVYSEDESGCIFSRRMIRDEEIRQARAAGGKMGGNPVLMGGNGGSGKVDNKVNLQPNLPPTPSSSSSSSSSNNKTPSSASADTPAGFATFWSTWPSSPRKVAKASCLKKWINQKLEPLAEQIITNIELMKQTEQWRKGFEPAPMTYLNGRRWEDGQQEPQKPEWLRGVVTG